MKNIKEGFALKIELDALQILYWGSSIFLESDETWLLYQELKRHYEDINVKK